MKIKTEDLIDLALEWAVAKCEGPNSEAACYYIDDLPVYLDEAPIQEWKPATNWAQGGPIIEREAIELVPDGKGSWSAAIRGGDEDDVAHGPTPLIAAMRCYVASQLGDIVEIPEELCNAPR